MPKKTKEQISFNMRQVKNKDSNIELILRKELWSRGLRYRKNVTGIIGKIKNGILNQIKIFGYLK